MWLNPYRLYQIHFFWQATLRVLDKKFIFSPKQFSLFFRLSSNASVLALESTFSSAGEEAALEFVSAVIISATTTGITDSPFSAGFFSSVSLLPLKFILLPPRVTKEGLSFFNVCLEASGEMAIFFDVS